MSARTKIVVFHMKEVVLGLFVVVLAIILGILVVTTFFKDHGEEAAMGEVGQNGGENLVDVAKEIEESEITGLYTPGVYTSVISLGDKDLEVVVCVDSDHINSISLENVDETVQTMYPLVEPSLDEIAAQVIANQSTEGVTYSENNQYTSIVLLGAIEKAIEEASLE